VYCALSMCLDSLNSENYVDVFQTVRALREQRPYILYSKVCYNDVMCYCVGFILSLGIIQVCVPVSCGFLTELQR